MNIFENVDYLHVKPNYFDNSQFLPPANEVWGMVIFSEAFVKNSVHRGGVSGLVGVCSWEGCLVWGVVCFWGVSAPRGPGRGVSALEGVPVGDPPGRLLLRAVRILLECILVNRMFEFVFHKDCSHGTIATAICLSQLIGCCSCTK